MRSRLYLPLVVFLIAAGAPSPEAPKDFSSVAPKTLGVEFLAPEKDEKTGFLIGGKNDTSLIAKLPSLAGRSIKDLEKDMRPGALSRLGFMGKDESLLEILTMDNRFVVEMKKLTHQDLARPLAIVGAVAAKHGLEKPYDFLYHGQRLRATAVKFRAHVDSPFDDGAKTNIAVTITNEDNGKKIAYSLLVPHLIERYGFYEGKGTPYRLEPQAILDVFEFLTKAPAKK